MSATCAAAPGNSVASIARLLGVNRSTIYLEGSYVSPASVTSPSQCSWVGGVPGSPMPACLRTRLWAPSQPTK
jgi:hypothetical protein